MYRIGMLTKLLRLLNPCPPVTPGERRDPHADTWADHVESALDVANDRAPADRWSANHPTVTASFRQWERELSQ